MANKDEKHIYDVIIIGGGPAGYTAALYACRAGLNTLLLEKESVGGQVARTSQIDNYPGVDCGIDGFSLGVKMQKQAEKFGTVTIMEEVTKVHLTKGVKEICTRNHTYWAKSVIIATGATPKHLDLPSEKELIGKGVHYCATCDGMFYKDKTVVVVGGGNTALTDAPAFIPAGKTGIPRAQKRYSARRKVYQEQMTKTDNIRFIQKHIVSELLPREDGLDVILKNVSGNELMPIACDGLFVSIGHYPASDLFRGILDLEDSGYIKANESTCTDIPGVFVAGDVRTKPARQIVTATADGAVAALHAENYVAEFGATSNRN